MVYFHFVAEHQRGEFDMQPIIDRTLNSFQLTLHFKIVRFEGINKKNGFWDIALCIYDSITA